MFRVGHRARRTAGAAAAAAALWAFAPAAHAQFQVTTYKAVDGNPAITSMAIADQYFNALLPSRFTATSTVPQVDLFENGGAGQFLLNHPFPGLDQNTSPGDTDDFTARVTGTLTVTTAGMYDFFTDSDDGNRFRLDLNQNGTFEDATESIVPDGGLQGAGTPERSALLNLATGSYVYEIGFFERGGGGSIDAGYRVNGAGTQFVIGDASGGIGMTGPATVRAVGRDPGSNVDIVNFAQADALRTGTGLAFTATESRNVFNITDSGGQGAFGGDLGAPGLGAPDANDDDDFLVVGTGTLVVAPGQAGDVFFRSNTDDGGRLRLDLNGDGDFGDAGELVINDDVLSGPHDFTSAAVNLAAGNYLIEYSMFERGGGAEGELSARVGTTGPFILVGDTGGLAVIPEPASLGLLAVGGLSLLARRRRNA